MALDHSKTYRLNALKNVPHVARLSAIRRNAKKYCNQGDSLADFGCSNGYITAILKNDLSANQVKGFDLSENIEEARLRHPDIKFDYFDLNNTQEPREEYDSVTCLETLEHVGDVDAALRNLLSHKAQDGTLLISVPIEIGFWGVIKYIIKRTIYQYPFPLPTSEKSYVKDLFFGNRISRHRPIARGYGSHFGFDHRNIADKLDNLAPGRAFSWNSFTTRFYCVK